MNKLTNSLNYYLDILKKENLYMKEKINIMKIKAHQAKKEPYVIILIATIKTLIQIIKQIIYS